MPYYAAVAQLLCQPVPGKAKEAAGNIFWCKANILLENYNLISMFCSMCNYNNFTIKN